MILCRNTRRPRRFPKGRLGSEGHRQKVAGSGGGAWGRGAALSGNQGGWPGSWRCQEGHVVHPPSSWRPELQPAGGCTGRGRIQPRGSELDRELSRACCGGEGCIPESLTHGGQGLSGRLELSVNPRKEDPAKLLGQFVVHGPQSALPTADLGGSLAHPWSPGVSILSPVYRHSVALGQDWVYLVIPVSQYLAQSRSP